MRGRGVLSVAPSLPALTLFEILFHKGQFAGSVLCDGVTVQLTLTHPRDERESDYLVSFFAVSQRVMLAAAFDGSPLRVSCARLRVAKRFCRIVSLVAPR